MDWVINLVAFLLDFRLTYASKSIFHPHGRLLGVLKRLIVFDTGTVVDFLSFEDKDKITELRSVGICISSRLCNLVWLL